MTPPCYCSHIEMHDEVPEGPWYTADEPPLPWVVEGTFGCALTNTARDAALARRYFGWSMLARTNIASFVARFYLDQLLDETTKSFFLTNPDVIAHYLHLSIADELNYHRGVHKHWKRDQSAYGWMMLCKTVGRAKAARYAQEVFEEHIWQQRYGGWRWAVAARRLAEYHEGKLPPVLFLDAVFSLQHNTGSILNKLSWQGLQDLDTVLQLHGDEERWRELERFQ